MRLKITPTCFGSYAIHHQEVQLYLTEITRSGSQMFVVRLVGVWQRNFELVVCVCTVKRAAARRLLFYNFLTVVCHIWNYSLF